MSTRISRSRNSRTRLAVLLLCGGLWAAAPAAAFCAESAELELFPASDYLFGAEGKPDAVPGPGQVLVVGRCEGPDFAIDGVNQVELVAPGGRRVPLHVEEPRIYRDPVADNKIVSLRVYFLAGESEVAPGAGGFELRWGPEVKAANRKVASIVADPARRARYREFRRRVPLPPAGAVGDQSSTLWIIADSKADYYFLWYLVPMVLIFVLLTVRKIRAGRAGPDDGGSSGDPTPRSPR